ncbi:hypothetical protein Bpfe_008840, partial [Biomphalaria pfeifferi]
RMNFAFLLLVLCCALVYVGAVANWVTDDVVADDGIAKRIGKTAIGTLQGGGLG